MKNPFKRKPTPPVKQPIPVIPDGYQGDFQPRKLNIPQFGYDRLECKTRHIAFMWHVEDVSSFRRLAK